MNKWVFFFIALLLVASILLGNAAPSPVSSMALQDRTAKKIKQIDRTEENLTTYRCMLAPQKESVSDEYTTLEIESFLCACIPGFIESSDIKKHMLTLLAGSIDFNRIARFVYVKHKDVDPQKMKEIENLEINKWFEKRVTVACTGAASSSDIATLKYFVRIMNEVSGREKFVFEEGAKVGNVVVYFSLQKPPSGPEEFMGESALLEDGMKTIFFKDKNKMKVETYRIPGTLIIDKTKYIKYTPEEEVFRKKNRIIKIFMTDIADANTRKWVLIHELLHSVGFSGHSPSINTNIFPIRFSLFTGKGISAWSVSRGEGDEMISRTTGRMLEMLYRPEVLPGMSIKEASRVLARMKYRSKTSNAEIIAFLKQKKKELESQKKAILDKGSIYFDRKNEIHSILHRLENELVQLKKDVKKENKLPASVSAGKGMAEIMQLNIDQVNARLTELEQKVAEVKTNNPSAHQLRKLNRQVLLRKEDIEVLTEILREVKTNQTLTHDLQEEEKTINREEEEMGERLRRIVRQLLSIPQEISYLENKQS